MNQAGLLLQEVGTTDCAIVKADGGVELFIDRNTPIEMDGPWVSDGYSIGGKSDDEVCVHIGRVKVWMSGANLRMLVVRIEEWMERRKL